MRLFVACHIPREVKARLLEISRILGPAADLKWVNEANMHITLKFIGEASPGTLPEIGAALSGAALKARPFWLSVKGIGKFGPQSSLKVLWAGLSGDTGALIRLAATVDDALAETGIQREDRAFSPHITLARARQGAQTAKLWARVEPSTGKDFGGFEVRGFSLFESELRPTGPSYRVISEYSIV